MLFIGTGESGKSTVVKQMKIMHMNGFSNAERDMYRNIIHCNIVEGITNEWIYEEERKRGKKRKWKISNENFNFKTALATLVEMANVFGLAINPHLQVLYFCYYNNFNLYKVYTNQLITKIILEYSSNAKGH